MKNCVKHMIRQGQIRNFCTLNVKHYLFDVAEDAPNQRTQRSSVKHRIFFVRFDAAEDAQNQRTQRSSV